MTRSDFEGFNHTNIHMPKYCLTQRQLRSLASGQLLDDKPNGDKPNDDKPSGGKPKGGKPRGGKPHGGGKTDIAQMGDALQDELAKAEALKQQISLRKAQQETAILKAELEKLSCDDSKDE